MRDLTNVITLPIDLAVPFAAEQNFYQDARRRIITLDRWEYEKGSYLEEASQLLASDKVNYFPEDDVPPLIRVSRQGPHALVTSRSEILLECFNLWYSHRHKVFLQKPDPLIHRDNKTIEQLFNSYRLRFCTH